MQFIPKCRYVPESKFHSLYKISNNSVRPPIHLYPPFPSTLSRSNPPFAFSSTKG